MNGLLWQLTLLADQNRFRSLGDQFRGRRARIESDDLITGAIVLLVVALAAYGLSRLLARQERQRSYHSPKALMKELCRAHQLNRASRRRLARLAHWQRLAQPARLFLEPERFDLDNLGPELVEEAYEFQALREKLFALPQEPTPDAAPLAAASEATSSHSPVAAGKIG